MSEMKFPKNFSPELPMLFQLMEQESQRPGQENLGLELMLLAILQMEGCATTRRLTDLGVTLESLRNEIRNILSQEDGGQSPPMAASFHQDTTVDDLLGAALSCPDNNGVKVLRRLNVDVEKLIRDLTLSSRAIRE